LSKNSGADDSDLPEDYLALGWVVRPQGLKGEVKVSLVCDGLERLLECKKLELVKPGCPPMQVNVAKSYLHSDGDAVLLLKEVVGRDASEKIRGACLAVRQSEAPPLPKGQYRRHEVLGFAVETPDGRSLGTLEDLLEMPAHWVFVVRDAKGRERMLPAHPSVVKNVDLKSRRIVVDDLGEVEAEDA
jgi:16S rRNA processing protein RimM